MQNYFHANHHELILSPHEQESNTQTQSKFLHQFAYQHTTELTQSFGPTDISLPHPLHLSVSVQEKSIRKIKVEIGWLHQGIEKAFEAVPWKTCPSFATRINPLVPAHLALGLTFALEKLLRIDDQISILAKNYRILMLECARIVHHLQVVHQTISLVAPFVLTQTSARALEQARLLQKSVNFDGDFAPRWEIGGISKPIYRVWASQFKSDLQTCLKKTQTYKKNILAESQIEQRLTNIGVITKENALSLGITGPALRACGVSDDLRLSHPYCNYSSYAPAVALQKGGDAWTRLKIRLDEIDHAFDILQRVIDDFLGKIKDADTLLIPKSFHLSEKQVIPPGIITTFLESPEGELAITVVSNGEETPYRVRFRTPSFFQTAALSTFLKNADIDDVVLIILSLGITGLEVDR